MTARTWPLPVASKRNCPSASVSRPRRRRTGRPAPASPRSVNASKTDTQPQTGPDAKTTKREVGCLRRGERERPRRGFESTSRAARIVNVPPSRPVGVPAGRVGLTAATRIGAIEDVDAPGRTVAESTSLTTPERLKSAGDGLVADLLRHAPLPRGPRPRDTRSRGTASGTLKPLKTHVTPAVMPHEGWNFGDSQDQRRVGRRRASVWPGHRAVSAPAAFRSAMASPDRVFLRPFNSPTSSTPGRTARAIDAPNSRTSFWRSPDRIRQDAEADVGNHADRLHGLADGKAEVEVRGIPFRDRSRCRRWAGAS